MIYIVTAQLAALIALLWALQRTHRQEIRTIHGLLELQDQQRNRDLERIDNLLRAQHTHMSQPHPDLSALIDLTDRLCQRIQAPQQAVIDHALQQPVPPVPQTVLPHDDNAYWETQNVPKDELAEKLMAEELSGA